MGEVTIFRSYNIIRFLNKWPIYANGNKVGAVGNENYFSFELPAGIYEIQVRSNTPIFRMKIYSNTLKINIGEHSNIILDVRPHPSFFVTRKPKYFRGTESLLLLDMYDNFNEHLATFEQKRQRSIEYLQTLHYHRATWILMILSSIVLITSSIIYSNAFEDIETLPFFFGIMHLLNMISTPKISLARGHEHQLNIVVFTTITTIALLMDNSFIVLRAVYISLGVAHLILGWWLYKHRKPIPDYV